MNAKQSSFMHWAKTRPKVKYDLALSGILNLPLAELDLKLRDLELHGENSYGYQPLVAALASHCKVAPGSVVTVSGGTSMANHLAMAAILEHGGEILIEQPTYEPILAVANYLGAKIKRFPRRFESNYQIDMDELAKQVTPQTRLIALTNLHNPSSVLANETTLRKIAALARDVSAHVLVDEVYLEAMFENAPPTSLHLGPEFVAASSLTKGYGLSGLRCGWILAEPDLALKMRRLDDIFGATPPHPMERMSVIALARLPKIAARAKEILESNRTALQLFLNQRNDLEFAATDYGTTLFPRLRTANVEQLCTLLVEKYDTAVVPGHFFESPDHFRIGMCCAPEAFKAGLNGLAQALDELSA
ncbi:MAG TPA: pyridoxal phosphate-dependent aminotransferase [Chthoniobacterales bacterium]|nr:pyridoxal phosphate-dependent aminotransferase [Chthoniobacterales bacterium]